MANWLLKTEPSDYSYADLEREGKTMWDGVSNNLALIHLRAMKKGDRALIYHSGKEKALVGIAEIVSSPYPDPRRNNPKIVVVDVVPQRRLAKPVTLDAIKERKTFAQLPLVRIPRLSVMPLSREDWNALLAMAE